MNKPYRDDLKDMRFGEWYVIEFSHKKGAETHWLVRCSCGVEKTIVAQSLKNGKSTSCGHWKKEFLKSRAKHGKHGSRLYKVWAQMIQRSTNPNNISYENYGGRGVSVSEEWRQFANFERDMAPSWDDGLTLDRENNALGYSKENCRWATRKEQIRNRRPRSEWKNGGKRGGGVRLMTPKGEMNVLQAAKEFGVNYGTLRKRLAKGMSIEDALLAPIGNSEPRG